MEFIWLSSTLGGFGTLQPNRLEELGHGDGAWYTWGATAYGLWTLLGRREYLDAMPFGQDYFAKMFVVKSDRDATILDKQDCTTVLGEPLRGLEPDFGASRY